MNEIMVDECQGCGARVILERDDCGDLVKTMLDERCRCPSPPEPSIERKCQSPPPWPQKGKWRPVGPDVKTTVMVPWHEERE